MARCTDCIHYEACLKFADLRVILCGDKADTKCIMFKPTADVAPRAEVAKEIFEEIKDQLRGIFDFFRQDNDIRESCAIMFAISEVDKIEKKYTQPEPPKGD